MEIDIDDIEVYPTTQMLIDDMPLAEYKSDTAKRFLTEYKESLAEKLYDEYVCDRRLEPKAIIQLLLYACNKHGITGIDIEWGKNEL